MKPLLANGLKLNLIGESHQQFLPKLERRENSDSTLKSESSNIDTEKMTVD